jgi:hypothetical protein
VRYLFATTDNEYQISRGALASVYKSSRSANDLPDAIGPLKKDLGNTFDGCE